VTEDGRKSWEVEFAERVAIVCKECRRHDGSLPSIQEIAQILGQMARTLFFDAESSKQKPSDN
jgi:hypothetical protein